MQKRGNHSTIPKRFNKKKAQQKQTTNPPDNPTIRSQKTARTTEGVPTKSPENETNALTATGPTKKSDTISHAQC